MAGTIPVLVRLRDRELQPADPDQDVRGAAEVCATVTRR